MIKNNSREIEVPIQSERKQFIFPILHHDYLGLNFKKTALNNPPMGLCTGIFQCNAVF
jgi:hypothetical protein